MTAASRAEISSPLEECKRPVVREPSILQLMPTLDFEEPDHCMVKDSLSGPVPRKQAHVDCLQQTMPAVLFEAIDEPRSTSLACCSQSSHSRQDPKEEIGSAQDGRKYNLSQHFEVQEQLRIMRQFEEDRRLKQLEDSASELDVDMEEQLRLMEEFEAAKRRSQGAAQPPREESPSRRTLLAHHDLPMSTPQEIQAGIRQGRVVMVECCECSQILACLDDAEFMLCSTCWVFNPNTEPVAKNRGKSGICVGTSAEEMMVMLG